MGRPDRIPVTCPNCGTGLRAPLQFAGKRAKCRACGNKVPVPPLGSAVIEAEALPDDETELMPAAEVAEVQSVLSLVPLKPPPRDEFDDDEPPPSLVEEDEDEEEPIPIRSKPVGLLIVVGVFFILALACGVFVLVAGGL